MKKNILVLLSFLFLIPSAIAAKAEAILKGTAENSTVAGKVTFAEANGELKVNAEISGTSPGSHGFHIHENGSCDDAGQAAGGHFNPDNVKHGLLSKDGFSSAHAGDLGNVEIGPDGKGKLETSIGGLTLAAGKYGIGGKSVILHEKADNFGQPVGNAGGRIGCGIIEKEEEKKTEAVSEKKAEDKAEKKKKKDKKK